ncbi:hypothetical protein CH373_04340 [Leptospira perolatii]|uniref:TRL-like family protein n=1 Tax=Leptospira perolatii TaxID=2023191 RepID=A0A2M9ZQE9_9LEPT|nr:TRL domain-containing protein [Leptospira perolatii]PJZ68979.1 hypothetical protein CH360_12990 [Leptospira perolatii]PJZ74153.1 hypothetical protein CH373_04340 [Leptospira perolatii]
MNLFKYFNFLKYVTDYRKEVLRFTARALFFALVFCALSYCTGWSLPASVAPRVNTHPIAGASNPGQALVRGGILYQQTTYWSGDQSVISANSKSGESCSKSILSVIAIGNSGIESAMKEGSIEEVSLVEYSQSAVLGGILYHSFCTIVWGNKTKSREGKKVGIHGSDSF